MNLRIEELELRRRLLVARSGWHREQLRDATRVVGRSLRIARLLVLTARRIAGIYRH